MKYDAVIVASGKGERAKLGYNKAFYLMKDGKTVLQHSASLFLKDEDCQKVIIVTSKDYLEEVFKDQKVEVVRGGERRQDSVLNGLNKVISEYVLIHDGARPFLHQESLADLKKKVKETKACILAHKAIDTIKVVKDGFIEKTIDRNLIYMAETPQAFETSLIKKCYAEIADLQITDEASLLENLGYKVAIVENKLENKKLTKKEDFENL